MKSMLLSLLIVALLLVLYLRPWTGGGDNGRPPPERFIRSCTMAFADRSRPEDYCRCLWSHGVRSPGDTLIKPSAQAAAAACRARSGGASPECGAERARCGRAPTAPVDQGTQP